MKILIDINHPAHVHYFRNFIIEMQSKDHRVYVTARDKEVSLQLLQAYNITFKPKGFGGKTIGGKLINMIRENFLFLSIFLRFKPDVTLSAGSPSLAQISWLFRKPHFALDDTEHAKFAKKLYLPFSKYVFTPFNYFTDLGKKQIRVNYFTELCYLHKKWFKPLSPDQLKLKKPYALIRLIAWEANHDIGQSGLDSESKKQLITRLQENDLNIYISGEKKLPEEFEKYQIDIPPEYIHDALSGASIFIGESATMAAEATILGTKAIYVNSLNAGSLEDLENNYGLINLRNSKNVINLVNEILSDIKNENSSFREKILMDKIDFTSFLIWFVENYPASEKKLLKNKDILNEFR